MLRLPTASPGRRVAAGVLWRDGMSAVPQPQETVLPVPAIIRFEEFGCAYLLIDGTSPGSGEVFDWRLTEGVVDHGRLFVSGGLNSANVADAVVRLHPHGVDVATGVERAPGEKDPAKLAAFVAAVRRGAALVAAQHPGAGGDDDADGAPYDWLTDR